MVILDVTGSGMIVIGHSLVGSIPVMASVQRSMQLQLQLQAKDFFIA